MRVTKVEKIQYDTPVPVYDVINAIPYHNFIIHGNSNYISHGKKLQVPTN